MRKASLPLAFAAIAVLAGSLAAPGMRSPVAVDAPEAPLRPAFAEAKWPFLLDQWGLGRAFVCPATDCGAKVEVYVRPKIGFFNCSSGVSDDTELERVADTDLISQRATPLGPGRPIKVGWMDGRVRSYRTADGRSSLVSIAYNDECDVVVGVASSSAADPTRIEPAVVAFLDSRPMVLWAKKELGLEFVFRQW